jgi:excisionase family DNA binding protein
MATEIAGNRRLLTTEQEAGLARNVLETLSGADGVLSVSRGQGAQERLPREIGVLLQQVLEAVATGASVTVMAIPREVTTSTAAAMLGVSRTTVMKLVRDGSLPSHKVGSHTRLAASDVLAARQERQARERAAFALLLELEGDED